MCGIVGIAAAGAVDGREALLRMRDTLVHRGPDDAGDWWDGGGRVGLAHRRLAIIDLSPGGRQPMEDAAGRLRVTFNGEIYNYRQLRAELRAAGHAFRTESDTEVLLEAYRAWGPACLERLNGMFAFALWDEARDTLLVARDRAGEKPLFYRHAGGRLVFASELKALLEYPGVPRELDLEALDAYLAYGYVPGDRCILRGVRKLPQGHALVFRPAAGELRVWRYWDLPAPPSERTGDGEALARELEALLEDSVRLRLEADVPVGVLLSGGLDSSLVTALAARVSSLPVRTFTAAFPGHGRYDESAHARRVARHFGTEHAELPIEPASVELLPELARQYDEPMADSSMVPTFLISRAIRQHATVALGGDGGDELFGGYPHYSWLLRQRRARALVPAPVRRGLSAVGRALPVGTRGRNHLIGFGGDQAHGIAHVNLYFDAATRRRLLAPALGSRPLASREAERAALCGEGSALQAATALDFRTYLVDDILVKVDRASMLTSLEVRAPFLDHRVIEFAFGRVPDALRATATARKVLLRILGARLLPPGLDLARKQGFSLPLGAWFRGEWGEFMRGVLAEADPALFDRAVIGEALEAQRRGLGNMQRIFALTLFELWRREYRVALPSVGGAR